MRTAVNLDQLTPLPTPLPHGMGANLTALFAMPITSSYHQLSDSLDRQLNFMLSVNFSAANVGPKS